MIVTGKGGTGKTTLAATLALGAASRGLRVLVGAMDPDARLATLLGDRPTPLAYEPSELRPNVWACHLEPFAALSEYLGLQIGSQRIVEPVLRNRAFRQLLMAAPGWRDLITLGKVWHLEQMEDSGRPRFDLIVVDAPATGHGLTFLDVPRVVVSAVRAGPLREHTERVEALIVDPKRTLLLPVALAEELPTRETIELVTRVRDDLRVPVDRIVVNAVHASPYPDDLDVDAALAKLAPDLRCGSLPPSRMLRACGAILRDRAALNQRYVDELARETGLPTPTLPYLRDGLRGSADLETLADALLGPLRAAA